MAEWSETELGKLPKHWAVKPFSEVIEKGSLSYGVVQPGTYQELNSVPIIRVQNIRNGRIVPDDVLKISTAIEAKHKRTRLQGGEFLLTVVGSVGDVVIVPEAFKNWNVARAVSVSKISDNHDKRFIKYCFATEIIKYQMYGHTNDTVQPTLNLSSLEQIKLPIPPLAEQKAIAGVLGSLDDKIDLLQRQNKTLEGLAQTLFRHWFVDGAEDDWEETPLDKIADYLNGLACQNYPPENEHEKLPVLKIKDLKTGISDQSDWATSNVPEEYIVENGDVIFSWSGSLMVKIWDGAQCVLNQHLFKVTSNQYPKWFYYLWTIHHLQEFIAIAESKATTMGHIKRGDLSNAIVLVPSEPELKEMDQIVTPLINKLVLNNQQITQLTALRDTLLPKLMSGEVRVRQN